jgi:hypothetical protein
LRDEEIEPLTGSDSSVEKVLDFLVKSGVFSDFPQGVFSDFPQDEAGHLRTLDGEAAHVPRCEYAFDSVAHHVLVA